MDAPLVTRIRADGLACRVHSTPRAQSTAPAYVLLHGIGMSHRYLSKLHEQLGQTRPTLSFDLPGFGGTPKPDHPLSVESYASVISGALDQIGVQRCVLIGHSMGSQFAVEVARQRPQLVSGAVLIGPVVNDRRPTALQQGIDLVRDSWREPPSANLIVFGDYLRCGPKWYLTALGEMLRYPTEERIRDVAAPVLVIRGARDPIARAPWCTKLAAGAIDGRLVEVAGSSHVVQRSATLRVAAEIEAFTRTHPLVGERP